MGGAVDIMDKKKSEELWSKIFATSVSGLITNAYTKGDAILLLYSASQIDYSLGRHPIYTKKRTDGQRRNLNLELSGEESGILPAVADSTDLVFKLNNYNVGDIKSGLRLGIGHTDYRDQMQLILRHIHFRE